MRNIKLLMTLATMSMVMHASEKPLKTCKKIDRKLVCQKPSTQRSIEPGRLRGCEIVSDQRNSLFKQPDVEEGGISGQIEKQTDKK